MAISLHFDEVYKKYSAYYAKVLFNGSIFHIVILHFTFECKK